MRWTRGSRLGRRRDPRPGAVRARSRGRGAALRAGDLRGAEGLPAERRRRGARPARAERAAVPGLGRAAGDAGRCPRPRSCSSIEEL